MLVIDNFKKAAFWSKVHLLKPRKARYYREVLKNQQLSRPELDTLNWRKRMELVAYAYRHVPFYRRKYRQAGIHPGDLRSPEDFCHLPILTKEEVRNHAHELIAEGARKQDMLESCTGGSTGAPVRVWHDRRFHFEPLLWRMLGWWGVPPEVNSAYVLRLTRKGRFEQWVNAAIWWPTRRAHLDASLMSEAELLNYARELQRLKPQLIQGYAGSVHHLAVFLEKEGLSIPRPKAVWVTSSPISKVQRLKMEEVFRAPVYDQYGCGEVFCLAAECAEQKGLHVFWDARCIEFVDPEFVPVDVGDFGSVLVTDLENRVFPLIRYQNGDEGRFLGSTCRCGRELPLIDSIRGRTTDCLTLPDGTRISGDYLTTIFDEYPDAVQAFQVRQFKDYSVHLVYVPAQAVGVTATAIQRVKTELETKCRAQVKVLTEPVEQIPHERGKLRFVTSDVGHRC